jgi:hypothetical protein
MGEIMTRTYRRRWLVGAMTALAMLLSVGTLSAPAQAAPPSAFEQCFPLYDRSTGELSDWICMVLVVTTHPCPTCPAFGIEFSHPTDPDEWAYTQHVLEGMEKLEAAAHAKDPNVAESLRSDAKGAFLAAADWLGAGEVDLRAVGYANKIDGVLEPQPIPWLEDAGLRLVNGLTLMQQALATSDQQYVALAMMEFESAHTHLTNH